MTVVRHVRGLDLVGRDILVDGHRVGAHLGKGDALEGDASIGLVGCGRASGHGVAVSRRAVLGSHGHREAELVILQSDTTIAREHLGRPRRMDRRGGRIGVGERKGVAIGVSVDHLCGQSALATVGQLDGNRLARSCGGIVGHARHRTSLSHGVRERLGALAILVVLSTRKVGHRELEVAEGDFTRAILVGVLHVVGEVVAANKRHTLIRGQREGELLLDVGGDTVPVGIERLGALDLDLATGNSIVGVDEGQVLGALEHHRRQRTVAVVSHANGDGALGVCVVRDAGDRAALGHLEGVVDRGGTRGLERDVAENERAVGVLDCARSRQRHRVGRDGGVGSIVSTLERERPLATV